MRRRASPDPRPRSRPQALALLALLLATGVVQPAPPAPVDPGQVERAERDLRAAAWAFHAHYVDTGHWPIAAGAETGSPTLRELGELNTLTRNARGDGGWNGPYLGLDRVPGTGSLIDPWGSPYLVGYQPSGRGDERPTIRLYSCGANRRLDSSLASMLAGSARGDDLTALVTQPF